MRIPAPSLGLVMSYAYLWHHEHHAGRSEGAKDRPCVIVLSVVNRTDGTTKVGVVPITHRAPSHDAAVELPIGVKRHLGLDSARSWIILNEINEFTWPGFDLRPIHGSADRADYGFLPPRLFSTLLQKLGALWAAGQTRATPRS